jgi:2-polyprenyl-6-methoxyphenol hydroxylase-like FAD-dependent oxidoreductase
VITDHPDRQVLVVGDTVVGLVLTLVLRHAGYDPVVVSGTASPVASRVSYLCPPAVRTLEAVGVGTAVRDCGTTVDSVTVDESASQREPTALSMERGRSETPLVVDTGSLRRTLEAHLPDQHQGGGRTVETITRRDDGLIVEFRDGIREWFDIVVDAGGGGDVVRPAGVDSPTADPLAQYETTVDTDSVARPGIRDYWRSNAFVQALQSPNGSGSLLRVTAPPSEIDRVLDDGNWEPVLRHGSDAVSDEAEFEPRSVRQARASDAAADWWGTGRVAFCGPAACPVAPASGFDVTFGVEDAIAFVTELYGATRPVSDIVGTYSSRRADRLTTLLETVETAEPDHQYQMPRSIRPPLDTLGTLRTVTLATFLGSSMEALQRDGFGAN